MVEPRFFVPACFEGRTHPCISLWVSGGSSSTTVGSISSTLSIHVLLAEWPPPVLILFLSTACADLLYHAFQPYLLLKNPHDLKWWVFSKQRKFDNGCDVQWSIFACVEKQSSKPWWLQTKPSNFLFSWGQIHCVKETSKYSKFSEWLLWVLRLNQV